MKVLIDISCNTYERARRNSAYGVATDVEKAVANGEVLDEMTNGDVIKAMFPNLEVEIEGIHITCWIDEHRWFAPDYDWWNAPYRKVEEE